MATPARRPQQVPVSPAIWMLLHLEIDALDTLLAGFQKGAAADAAAPEQSAAIAMLGKRLRKVCQEALQQLRGRFEQWLRSEPEGADATRLAQARELRGRLEAWLTRPVA